MYSLTFAGLKNIFSVFILEGYFHRTFVITVFWLSHYKLMIIFSYLCSKEHGFFLWLLLRFPHFQYFDMRFLFLCLICVFIALHLI